MTTRALLLSLAMLAMRGVTSAQEELNTLPQESAMKTIKLPAPRMKGATSLEEALLKRRSVRAYSEAPLTMEEISQLLWAAQGITEKDKGLRTAPSAGALYPLEVYMVVGNVTGLAKGVYQYRPHEHILVKVAEEDVRKEVSHAALDQESVRDAPAVLVFSAVM
jgi:nitroreductase